MTPPQQIDGQIKTQTDWKGDTLQKLRDLIHRADQEIKEEWKWDTAVFTKNGMVCAISVFKVHVKMNFFKGAKLSDPHNLINNGLDSKAHRAIDFFAGDKLNDEAIIALIVEAIALNSKK